jgi:hypothetical protein
VRRLVSFVGKETVMSPSPTYGDRSEIDPSLPDENDPARRSKIRTTKDDPTMGEPLEPATLKPGLPPER